MVKIALWSPFVDWGLFRSFWCFRVWCFRVIFMIFGVIFVFFGAILVFLVSFLSFLCQVLSGGWGLSHFYYIC